MSWLSRLANVFRSGRLDDDLEDELRFHLEEKTRRLIAEGMPPDAAAQEARRRLGNGLTTRERSRDIKLLPWLDALVRDVRFGCRVLRKDAVVTTAAILSLALAMGACIAAFALIDALILRPLPVASPQRLVYLAYPPLESSREPGGENTSFSYPAFAQFVAASAGRVSLFGFSYQGRPSEFSFGHSGVVEKARGQYASGTMFSQLGLMPAAGRLLGASDDDLAGTHRVAVLSHSFWTRRFGAEPSVIGRWLTFDRKAFQIVGVAPAGFTGVEPGIRTDFWMPLTTYAGAPEALTAGGNQWLRIMGRLAPAVSAEDARAALQRAYTNFLRERAKEAPPDTPRDLLARFVRTPLVVHAAPNGLSYLRLDFERPLWILAAVVGLVLLIACSNVANLLTARAAARDREMALRLSIGAGRGRLVQQLLIESALMSAAACALGLIFAAVAAPAIVRMLAPGDAPVYLELEASWRLIAFTSLTVTATSLLFGLAPALRASGTAPIGVLKAVGGRVIGRVASLRPLVAAQVGFSLAVVFLASLLVASFVRLTTTDMGFTKTGVTLFNIWSEELGEREGKDLIATNALAWQTLERIRQVSGVEDASLSFWGLFEGSAWSTLVKIPGREQDSTEVYYLEVSPGFMRTMGIRLLNGRDFVFGDIERYAAAPHGPVPVIVNDAFAQRFFSERRAVGRRFDRVVGRGPAEPQDIVGIVANAKYRDVRENNLPTVYLPSRGLNGKTLEVRSTADPEALARRVRLELSRIDPAIKVTNVIQQSTLVDNTLLRERLLALLSAFFGVVSIVLALIGMYGVLTYTVVQRTREIGIRMALGARQGSVVRSVLGDVVWTTGVGLIAGLACGLALARFVRALLFEVTPFDVMSIMVPIAMLLVAAVIAAIPPARRAVRIDPIEALRYE